MHNSINRSVVTALDQIVKAFQSTVDYEIVEYDYWHMRSLFIQYAL